MIDLRGFLLDKMGKNLSKLDKKSQNSIRSSNQKHIDEIHNMLKSYYKLPSNALFLISDSDKCPPEVVEYIKNNLN